jgi:hypothetical protein
MKEYKIGFFDWLFNKEEYIQILYFIYLVERRQVANSITTINSTGAGYFKIAGTNGFSIPSGTTEQRPGQVEIWLTRFNTSDGRLEIYDGTQWISAAGASGGITAGDAEEIAILAALMLG